YFSISGMKGRTSSRPSESRVARISALLRTSTRSPTRSFTVEVNDVFTPRLIRCEASITVSNLKSFSAATERVRHHVLDEVLHLLAKRDRTTDEPAQPGLNELEFGARPHGSPPNRRQVLDGHSPLADAKARRPRRGI